ncbi:DUF4419 domain-containing protein [Candidatus Dojkabacteria bacterium]|jgi:hypothetical protein|nr:DUF4419 domain-containing protein [Candidatus Dojkabacteria bacterium]
MRIINIKNTKLKPIIQDEMLEVQGKFLVENNYIEIDNLTDELKNNILFEKIFICGDNIPEALRFKKVVYNGVKGNIFHKNYIDYLKIAYNNDYGIVISPNHIWFTILCSISKIIKDNPEEFKKYFTISDKKESIILEKNGNNMIEMPMEDMVDQLFKNNIPKIFTKDLIIPKLSTTTPEFEFACSCAFLDTVSPYYEYRYSGCGYNKIKVLGTKKDYEILEATLNKIIDICGSNNFKKIYGEGFYSNLRKIISNYDDDKYWERILWTEEGYINRKVDGWIMPFYTYNADFAVVEYTESLSNKKYALATGILSSKIKNGYLVPKFEKFIVEL